MGHSSPDWVAALWQDSHFQKILENRFVIVWQLELNPGESTRLDRYGHDFLEIAIEPGTISMADERGQLTRRRLQPGVQLIRGGFAQVLKNTDKGRPFQAVFVEFRVPVGAERWGPEAQLRCPSGGDFGGTFRHHALGIVETDQICARRFLMGASVRSPALVVAIRPARVASGASGSSRLLKAGQAVWLISGEPSVQAPAPSAVDFVGIQFKEAQQSKW